MSIPVPTPAFVKKMVDQKKALESEKPASPSKNDSVTSNSSKANSGSRSKSGKKNTFSGPKNGSRSTSPTPKEMNVSPSPEAKTVTSSSLIESPVVFEASDRLILSTTNRPIVKDKPQKPFVRPEHLTSRPLAENEDLAALKKSLTQSSTPRSAGNSKGRTKPARGITSTTDRSKRGQLISKIERNLEQQSRAKHGKKENA